MKIKAVLFIVLTIAVTAMLLSIRHSSEAKKHEGYLYDWGIDLQIYLGDNNKYPKTLKEHIAWRVNTTGGDPNEVIESWLQLCVCPLTNHKPQTLDDVDDWADIKIVPYLSVFLPGEVMLAYCPAANHNDQKVYVVLSRSVEDYKSIRELYPVQSISQEVFNKKLEGQRIAFEAIANP